MTAWVRTSSPAAQFRLNSDLLTSWELWAAALLWPASASCTIRIISARRLFPPLQFFLQKHPLGRSRLPFLTAIIIFNSTFWPVFLFTRLSGWKTWPKVWRQQLVDSSGFSLSKDFVTCSRDLFPFSQQSVSEVQHWGSVSRSGSSFSSSELVNEKYSVCSVFEQYFSWTNHVDVHERVCKYNRGCNFVFLRRTTAAD